MKLYTAHVKLRVERDRGPDEVGWKTVVLIAEDAGDAETRTLRWFAANATTIVRETPGARAVRVDGDVNVFEVKSGVYAP